MSSDSASFIGGTLLLLACCIFSSAGGIGGGGLNVPVLLVVFGYDYKVAVALSLCAVLGNNISQCIINWRKSHPHMKKRPLIYWEAVLVLLPAQLGGSNIGAILGKLLPDAALLILAIVVLMYAIIKTGKKGRKLWRKESEAENRKTRINSIYAIENPITNSNHSEKSLEGLNNLVIGNKIINTPYANDHSIPTNNQPLLARASTLPTLSTETTSKPTSETLKSSNSIDNPATNLSENLINSLTIDITEHPLTLAGEFMNPLIPDTKINPISTQPVTPTLILREMSHSIVSEKEEEEILDYPVLIMWVLIGIWAVYCIFFVAANVAVDNCSVGYFSLSFASYPFIIATIVWGIRHIAKKQLESANSVIPGDINFNQLGFTPSIISGIIGILCALLGIGGGELMGPLLLSYHILPQVSSATTSMMSFLNTASNIIRFGIAGRIELELGFLMMVIGLVGGAIGRFTALYITQRYNRASLLVFLLVGVLTASVFLLIYDLIGRNGEFSIGVLC